MVANGDIKGSVLNGLVNPLVVLSSKRKKTPVAFVRAEFAPRSAKSAFSVICHGLHFASYLSSRCVGLSSAVNDVRVIDKGAAHKPQDSPSDRAEPEDFETCSPHHVDERGTDACPCRESGAVPLTYSLKWWVSRFAVLRVGKPEGGADTVIRLLWRQ